MDGCPDEKAIVLYLAGDLPVARRDAIRLHLGRCHACRELVADEARDAPARLLGGKYVIERELAAGGMGRVMLGRHAKLGRPVAIKVLRCELADDEASRRRFDREARAAAALRGRHVVQVLDVGEDEEPFMVMELLDGADLDTVVRRDGPLPVAQAIRLVLEACTAVSEAHALGILHRDLKPKNLFLLRGEGIVKVLDFGLAKALPHAAYERADDTATTGLGGAVGTPLYMSPEQFEGRHVDHRTDVWSLAATAYFLLTGRSAFEGGAWGTVRERVLAGASTPLRSLRPEVPEALAAVLHGALSPARGDRAASIDLFAAQLRAVELESEREPRAERPAQTMTRPAMRSRRIALGVLAPVVLLVVAAAAATLGMRSRDAPLAAPRAPTFVRVAPSSTMPEAPMTVPAPRPAAPHSPAHAASTCAPFLVDSAGIKRWNRACLARPRAW